MMRPAKTAYVPERATAPLSIGLYTYSTQPRGSVVHCAALAEALSLAGHAVTVYALATPGADTFYRALEPQLVCIACDATRSSAEQRMEQRIESFARCLRELAPAHDLHHAQDTLATNALLRARPRAGAVVRTVHHVEPFASAALEAHQARSIREADLVLAVSEATRADVRARYGIESERVHNGVEAARFERPSPGAVMQLRARIGSASAHPLVVSFGGIEPRKNTRCLLEAFVLLRERVPGARWLIVGGASILDHSAYRAAFEQRLAELPDDTRRAVVCTGVLKEGELAACYAIAGAVALPSLQEGFGLCALEALAAGVPLVASRRPPFTEYLDDECAWLVDPNDARALADALAEALTSPRRSPRAQAGALRASTYGWSHVAREHESLYRELIG